MSSSNSFDPPGMVWADRAPVCGCGHRLPNFSAGSVTVDDGDPSAFTIVAITVHVQCKACSATWDLKKNIQISVTSAPAPGIPRRET